jgi:hypothetical protein
MLHFALLRWNTQLYLGGGAVPGAVGVQIVRLTSIALLLGFAAWHGALPLLLTASGVTLARPLVLRIMRVAP